MPKHFTKLDEIKLSAYEKAYGKMTVDECLKLALSDEQIARTYNPFEPESTIFYHNCQDMINYAELIERKANASTPKFRPYFTATELSEIISALKSQPTPQECR